MARLPPEERKTPRNLALAPDVQAILDALPRGQMTAWVEDAIRKKAAKNAPPAPGA